MADQNMAGREPQDANPDGVLNAAAARPPTTTDRPPVSGEPHRDYAGRTCSTGLMHSHDRPPVSGEPPDRWETWIETCPRCLHEWTITRPTRRASTGAALDVAFLRRLADYPWGLHLAGTPNEAEAIGLIDELRARLAEQEGEDR